MVKKSNVNAWPVIYFFSNLVIDFKKECNLQGSNSYMLTDSSFQMFATSTNYTGFSVKWVKLLFFWPRYARAYLKVFR